MTIVKLLLFLVFIVAPVSVFLHELGHAIGATIVKANNVTIKMGLGNHLTTIQIGIISLKIHTMYFLSGFVHNERKKDYSSLEIIWITICGPLSSGIVVLLFFMIIQYISNAYLQLLLYFNLWLAIVNMIPCSIKGKQSDGYIILQAIFSK